MHVFQFIPLYLIATVHAKLVNVTLDDRSTGLVYSPLNSWADGADCQPCSAKPDINNLVNGTWHDATYYPGKNQPQNVSLSFSGELAIYVQCILAKNSTSPPINGHADMRFYIDDVLVGQFGRDIPNDSAESFEYHVPVYRNTSINAGLHSFQLQNGINGGEQSLILLDAIIYT
ncbi:uncharacterized protein EV420DRAFT_1277025 [Desarmillaria tabescens]|uniref:Uncharacterized protein n=1 Tax=Armillaria tabescens TaxID=1929756 RepID=A0AA39JMS2_ARMTA|nr:uncharacterized protein EV420DRAFT_1277025 [Desarmillaria tabescens]KAK0445641.1 hypothetical protein EV420DRAFT_1277025 [Desarmillaria tabescens]